MKKNAILIAGIMFAAGCATNQARYSSSTGDPSFSAQYDPAVGGYPSSVSESTTQHYNNTSVNDFHADSSVRGGSNESHGWAQRDFLPSEGSAHPINPAVQADSSIRGGSRAARENDWSRESSSSEPATTPDSRIKADSSIRGGSNEARFGRSFRSSTDQLKNPDENLTDESTSFDYYVLIPVEPAVASDETAIKSSPNWNPSDDLMADGIQTKPSDISSSTPNNDASVGGAASSEKGSSSSGLTLDDVDTTGRDVPAEPDDSSSLSSPGSQKDLNASSRLEKDISGEYSLDDQTDDSNLNSSTAIGGPGSTETGVGTSHDSEYDSGARDVSKESSDLFRDNRAQGVGSAASGEVGAASSGGASASTTDAKLAEKVKGVLTREESGTSGITQREITRNVQVTSHDGTVVLKGTVPSEKAKEMLEVRAREISGVRKVDNQLTVTAKATPSARDINFGRDLEDSTDQVHDIER